MRFGQPEQQGMGGFGGGPGGIMNQGMQNKSGGPPMQGPPMQGGPPQPQPMPPQGGSGGMDPRMAAMMMSPQYQAMQRQQQMQELQRQMDEARISGADPYRMADLNRQMGGMQQGNQQWMTETMHQMGNQGAGSMGNNAPGGGYGQGKQQQQGYLQRLLMTMLGGGGGPGLNR